MAVKFLRIAYHLSFRKGLPSDIGDAVEKLISFVPGQNQCLTSDLSKISDDLPVRVQGVREELLDELAIRQGSGGILYIDSRSIIENLSGPSFLDLNSTDQVINRVEFPSIAGLCSSSEWNRLSGILDAEKAVVSEKINQVHIVLRAWEIPVDPLEDGIRDYLLSARLVVQALESANQSIGDPQLQKQIMELRPANVKGHVNAIASVSKSLNAEEDSILSMDVKSFMDSVSFIDDVNSTLSRTEVALVDKFLNVVTPTDVENAKNTALSSLSRLQLLVPSQSIQDRTQT